MPPSLPTQKEINVYDDLDGRVACKNFFGKTLEEAEALFRENPLYYGNSLLWMGPIAFRFYMQAAIRFITSDHGAFEADFINGVCGTLNFRLEHEPLEELVPIAGQLAAICQYIVEYWEKFHVDEQIYGNLRHRYVALQQTFAQLAADQPTST